MSDSDVSAMLDDEGPRVSSSFDGPTVVIGVSGTIDESHSSRVWRDIRNAVWAAMRSTVVIVDLTRVGCLDSLGVAILLNLEQRARRRGVSLRLVVPHGHLVRTVLRLTGADAHVTICGRLEDALPAADANRDGVRAAGDDVSFGHRPSGPVPALDRHSAVRSC